MTGHAARVGLLLLGALLLGAGCGWFSRAKPAPSAPVAEAAREAEEKRRVAEVPRPVVARVPARDSPEILDRIIAVVNNDVITLSELQDRLAFHLSEARQPLRPGEEEKLKEQLLERLIESRLQLQEAAREQLTVEEVEIDEQLAEVIKRFKAKDKADFERLVKEQGLTMEGVRKQLREQVLIQKVVRQKVFFRVSVTEGEIDRYLLENREKLETGLGYQARHILVAPAAGGGEAAWEEARVRAEEIWAKVRAGEDFAGLARRYSGDPTAKDGGDLGVLKQGELAPELESQILRLRPGEAAAPTRSRLGYHIFKLEWREHLTGEALSQAKQQIRDILFRQKSSARMETWLGEIKKRAIIEIRM